MGFARHTLANGALVARHPLANGALVYTNQGGQHCAECCKALQYR